MEEARINLFELTGSSYEIGYQLGKKMLGNPQLIQMQKAMLNYFPMHKLCK